MAYPFWILVQLEVFLKQTVEQVHLHFFGSGMLPGGKKLILKVILQVQAKVY